MVWIGNEPDFHLALCQRAHSQHSKCYAALSSSSSSYKTPPRSSAEVQEPTWNTPGEQVAPPAGQESPAQVKHQEFCLF